MERLTVMCITIGVTLSVVGGAQEGPSVNRALLEKGEVCTECNLQRFMNWPGFDMQFEPIQTNDPQRCCDACKKLHGCRVWLLNRKTKECYIKEDVGFPIPCTDCVGGILGEDPYVGLNACRGIGRSCADRAAQAACQEVRNVCNLELSKDEIIEYPPTLPQIQDFPTKDERIICKFYIRETCKLTAVEAVKNVDPECHKLVSGQGQAGLADGCVRKNQAATMFRSLVDAICDSAV